MRAVTAWALALAAGSSLSCAAPPSEVELEDSTHRDLGDSALIPPAEGEEGSTRETLIAGTVSWERPEVGAISNCTATLVAPEVIITAAHCVSYGSTRYAGDHETFYVYRDGALHSTYPVDFYVSFGSGLGRDDITLMRLARPVPSSVATPARLASSDPARGTAMTIWGFGCTVRITTTDWQKRRFDFLEGSGTDNLCPGDSGGPVMTAGGEIVRINSGYYTDGSGDIFGSVPPNYGRLVAKVREWSSWDPGGGGGGGDPGADPCASYASTCGGCTPIAGCGWCGASGTCVSVDTAGVPIAGCAGDFVLDPPGCSGGSSCGVYEPFPEYTCWEGGGGFARCRPGGEPEYLYCPTGYLCVPGSGDLWCYAW